MYAIILEPEICKSYGERYAVVEIDARGNWSNVLGKTVRVVDSARYLDEAQEILKQYS